MPALLTRTCAPHAYEWQGPPFSSVFEGSMNTLGMAPRENRRVGQLLRVE